MERKRSHARYAGGSSKKLYLQEEAVSFVHIAKINKIIKVRYCIVTKNKICYNDIVEGNHWIHLRKSGRKAGLKETAVFYNAGK